MQEDVRVNIAQARKKGHPWQINNQCIRGRLDVVFCADHFDFFATHQNDPALVKAGIDRIENPGRDEQHGIISLKATGWCILCLSA